MKKQEKTSMSIARIIMLSIILILISGIGAMAASIQSKDIKIVLHNGYEMKIMTNKETVAEILSENSVILKENEKTIPEMESKVEDGQTIQIIDKSYNEVQIAKVTEEGVSTTLEQLLKNYDTIMEKIVVEQVKIPFETITKDATSSGDKTTSKVLQEGKEGTKEITYKVKYQNDVEIEKTVLSEKVIEEPVNKIIQVNKVVTTSRASTTSRVSEENTSGDSEASARAWIIQRESRGNYSAVSGRYYGAYQMDRSRLNGDYSVENQDATAEKYVAARYGSWTNAKQHWLSHGWY